MHSIYLRLLPYHHLITGSGLAQVHPLASYQSSHMAGVEAEALSTAPAPSGDPAAAQRRDTRARLLGMVTFVLVVAACIVGGLMGSGRLSGGARREPAPAPFDAADIIDALMVGNEMRRNANETTPAGSASSSSSAAATTNIVSPAPAANGTTKGSAPSSLVTNPIEAIKAMFGGGSTAGARPMAAQLVTQPTADGIPAGAVITQSWKQLEGSGRSVICYPKNGTDVEHMIGADSPCNVLVLRNGPEKEYMVSRTLNVSTPKVILGQPAIMPVLNCTRGLERLFDGESAGGWVVLG